MSPWIISCSKFGFHNSHITRSGGQTKTWQMHKPLLPSTVTQTACAVLAPAVIFSPSNSIESVDIWNIELLESEAKFPRCPEWAEYFCRLKLFQTRGRSRRICKTALQHSHEKTEGCIDVLGELEPIRFLCCVVKLHLTQCLSLLPFFFFFRSPNIKSFLWSHQREIIWFYPAIVKREMIKTFLNLEPCY